MRPLYFHSKLLYPLRHGFFSRKGGISTGYFQSLNCGDYSNDSKENVNTNRLMISSLLGIEKRPVIFMRQVHSNKVYHVRAITKKVIEVDALVSSTPGLALGILTADCQPIFLHDPTEKVTAAIHAGWKGTLNGIISNTLKEMYQLGAKKENIRGAIGPSIRQKNYEFGKDLYQKFINKIPYSNQFLKQNNSNRFYFDLVGLTKRIFEFEGISKIESLDLCTYEHTNLFFSYRRSCHRSESQFGLNGSVIFT